MGNLAIKRFSCFGKIHCACILLQGMLCPCADLISRSGPSDQSRRELVGIEHHQIQTDFQPSPVWPVLPIDSASKKEDQAAVPLSRALQIPNTHHPCRQPAMGTISISGLTAFFHHGIKVDADKVCF